MPKHKHNWTRAVWLQSCDQQIPTQTGLTMTNRSRPQQEKRFHIPSLGKPQMDRSQEKRYGNPFWEVLGVRYQQSTLVKTNKLMVAMTDTLGGNDTMVTNGSDDGNDTDQEYWWWRYTNSCSKACHEGLTIDDHVQNKMTNDIKDFKIHKKLIKHKAILKLQHVNPIGLNSLYVFAAQRTTFCGNICAHLWLRYFRNPNEGFGKWCYPKMGALLVKNNGFGWYTMDIYGYRHIEACLVRPYSTAISLWISLCMCVCTGKYAFPRC